MTRNSQEAMKLYQRAFYRDPGNLGARVNYARLLARRKDSEDDLETAIRMLEQVAEATCDRPREAARYAALYSLAVARFDLGSIKRMNDADKNEGWRLCRRALATAVTLKEKVIEGRDGRAERTPINPLSWVGHRDLQNYCQELYPGVEALWVGLTLVCTEAPSSESTAPAAQEVLADLRRYLREKHETGATLSFQGLYNRACTLSIAAQMVRHKKLPSGSLDKAESQDRGQFLQGMASAAQGFFGTNSSDSDVELTEENLVDAAYHYLEMALRKNPSVASRDAGDLCGSFMSKDKSLRFLRDVGEEDTRAQKENRYRKLEEPYLVTDESAPAENLGLAELDILSDETAARLGELGIDTWSALFLRVATPHARTELAVELGISEATLVQWARLLDLLRIAELSVHDLNLLEKAQIHSRQQLENADPYQLAVLLRDLTSGHPDLVPPEQAEVDGWWVQAAKDPSLVILDTPPLRPPRLSRWLHGLRCLGVL